MKKLLTIKKIPLLLTGICMIFASCRKDDVVVPPDVTPVAPPDSPDGADRIKVLGFYLLNEGNTGSNKSTIDYMDLTAGRYHRNIYADANPTVPKELGDVGNDIGIYGSKLYVVVNCSNKIEVTDKRTVKRPGQIEIPNCRYVKFHEGYIIDVSKRALVTRNFIADGEEKKITMPYGIMIHPQTKDIYLTDAANYVFPGALICFDRNGKKKWTVQTGDIPAHFALLYND